MRRAPLPHPCARAPPEDISPVRARFVWPGMGTCSVGTCTRTGAASMELGCMLAVSPADTAVGYPLPYEAPDPSPGSLYIGFKWQPSEVEGLKDGFQPGIGFCQNEGSVPVRSRALIRAMLSPLRRLRPVESSRVLSFHRLGMPSWTSQYAGKHTAARRGFCSNLRRCRRRLATTSARLQQQHRTHMARQATRPQAPKSGTGGRASCRDRQRRCRTPPPGGSSTSWSRSVGQGASSSHHAAWTQG